MDLIATCARHLEADAQSELLALLGALGDGDASAAAPGISGIITAKTSLAPDGAIAALRRRLADEPWEFRYVMRVIPVHATSPTDAGAIAEAAAGLAGRIGEGQSYRITLEKRNSSEPGSRIISEVAGRIDRRVCLDSPDWIVLVEVLGGTAGVSVIRPDGILRIVREKMAGSDHDDGALD